MSREDESKSAISKLAFPLLYLQWNLSLVVFLTMFWFFHILFNLNLDYVANSYCGRDNENSNLRTAYLNLLWDHDSLAWVCGAHQLSQWCVSDHPQCAHHLQTQTQFGVEDLKILTPTTHHSHTQNEFYEQCNTKYGVALFIKLIFCLTFVIYKMIPWF